MDTVRMVRGASLKYCRVLQTYAECIRATARGCRGNMYYHTTSTLVEAWNLQFNCSYIVINAPVTDNTGVASKPKSRQRSVCDYKRTDKQKGRTKFMYCGLFGDPHLQTFAGQYQTCRVRGAWPLLDNSYLAVQVTNEEVIPGFSATATTKVCMSYMVNDANFK